MLKASNLSKHYGSFIALDDVTFSLRPGCVTGLLGHNGSGKTTILRLALGLERPTSGLVTIGGSKLVEWEYPYQRVGALLDASWVHPKRSAQAHLTWICQASRIARKNVAWALEEVGLTSVAEKKAGNFSLGMKQRLGLASTILGKPDLLILDEPMNGLDPDGIEWIRGFIKRQADSGCAVLLASHLLQEMDATADRVMVMAHGRLVFDGTRDELRGGTGTESFVEVECSDPYAAERVLNAELPAAVITATAQVVNNEQGLTVVRVSHSDVGAVGSTLQSAGIGLNRIENRSTSLQEAYTSLTHGHEREGAVA